MDIFIEDLDRLSIGLDVEFFGVVRKIEGLLERYVRWFW